jgi:hypothetical protein
MMEREPQWSLQLELVNVADEHVMKIGPERLDLTTLAAAPSIVADTTLTDGVFAIGHAGSFKTENFNNFASFVTQLALEINGTTAVAAGQYDTALNAFTAKRLAILLSN